MVITDETPPRRLGASFPMVALRSMRAFHQSRVTTLEEGLVRLHEGAPSGIDHSAWGVGQYGPW
jgi:hypothetical protein